MLCIEREYGECVKCTLYPKLPYSILQKVKIIYNDKEVAQSKKEKDFIKKVEFFIPTISCFETYLFKIDYTLKEDTIGDIDQKCTGLR